jgi:peptidoglycan/xylan/chitin deacetylase (PgdA/CDA1 family)
LHFLSQYPLILTLITWLTFLISAPPTTTAITVSTTTTTVAPPAGYYCGLSETNLDCSRKCVTDTDCAATGGGGCFGDRSAPLGLCNLVVRPQPSGSSLFNGVVVHSYTSGFVNDYYGGCKKPGQIALTFDDGPEAPTPALLEVLRAKNAPATFFVLGTKLTTAGGQAIIQQAFSDGHIIGSHSFSHNDFRNLNQAQIDIEMSSTDTAIYNAIGKKPKFFRPPFFGYTALSNDLTTNKWQKVVVFAGKDTLDYDGADQLKWYDRFAADMQTTNPAKDSFIVLGHDIFQTTVDKVGNQIDVLRALGYKLVSLAECMDVYPYL